MSDGPSARSKSKTSSRFSATAPRMRWPWFGQGKTKDQVLAETGCVVGVNDLSLSIGSGEIFVIMGLSGSGKSTLVRHFNRLIDPTSGAILVDGDGHPRNTTWTPCANFAGSKISMVFQSFGLLPHQPCWTTSPTA